MLIGASHHSGFTLVPRRTRQAQMRAIMTAMAIGYQNQITVVIDQAYIDCNNSYFLSGNRTTFTMLGPKYFFAAD